MIFSEKLKELRKERKITQEQLASIIGVERSSVGKYETGTQPSTDIIKRIADYFDVSVDYLLGEYIDSKGISIARKRVAALLEERDPPFGDVEAAFGTSIATLKAWSNGYGDFFNDKLDTLANFFGVSVDYLLGREETKKVTDTDDYSDVKVALFGGDGEVTDAMWDEVKQFADYVKAKYLKEKQ